MSTSLTVRYWNAEHPSEVTKLLDALDKVQEAAVQAPDWRFVERPAKTVEIVLENARRFSLEGTAIQRAMTEANRILEGKLALAVKDNQDHYIAQVQPLFQAAAEKFEAAHEILPEKVTNESLASFTTEQFKAYQEAREAADIIKAAQGFMFELSSVVRDGGLGELRPVFLVAAPDSADTVQRIQYATEENDSAGLAVYPELRAALRAGATLRLATASGARAGVQELLG